MSASEGGGTTVRSQKYECTDGITQIDYFTTDRTGEFADKGAAFDKCFESSDGSSYKTDGELMRQAVRRVEAGADLGVNRDGPASS